jgi:uncharacterized protein
VKRPVADEGLCEGFAESEFGPVRLVVIQATPFCNLNCDYCYLPDRRSKDRLSLDLIEPLFKNLFTSRFVTRPFTVVWHAGEPLAAPIQFYESALQKIDELDGAFNSTHRLVTHAIQTNGTLINQAWCDLFKRHNVNVGVSIDGPAFIHDRHRKTQSGKGTHARTMEGVALLKRNGIDRHVITVLTNESLDYPEELFNFFVHSPIKRIGFNIEETEGINQSSTFRADDMEARYRAFMKRMYELTKRSGALSIREFDRMETMISRSGTLIRGDVSTPFAIINIANNGDFSTFSPELLTMRSSTYGDFVLGNVLQDTFESVCHTEKFRSMYRDIRAGIARCERTCEYFSLCGGGAPSNKYYENGSFRSAETRFCRLSKKALVDTVLEEFEASLGLSGS